MKRTNCVWTLTPKPIYWNKWLPTEELELKKKWGKGGNTLWENLYQKYLADRSILEILFDRLKLIKCHIVKLGSAGNKCWRYIFDTPNIFTICNQGVVVMYWKIDVKVLPVQLFIKIHHNFMKANPSILTRLWYFNLSTLFATEFEIHTFSTF